MMTNTGFKFVVRASRACARVRVAFNARACCEAGLSLRPLGASLPDLPAGRGPAGPPLAAAGSESEAPPSSNVTSGHGPTS